MEKGVKRLEMHKSGAFLQSAPLSLQIKYRLYDKLHIGVI
jgi:hypothetical protein